MDEHFLFNTLNTVYCKAMEEDAFDTAEMLVLLSRYFRISLSKGHDKVALTEIVQLITDYLSIQQIRFGKRLSFGITCFDGIEKYQSLKYLFQPIVENAVIHAFEGSIEKCELKISFNKKDNHLLFVVKDNGIGIDEATLLMLNRDDVSLINLDKKGALQNIREQIRIEYGEPYGIHIESCQGAGTTVTLEIPLEDIDTICEKVSDE